MKVYNSTTHSEFYYTPSSFHVDLASASVRLWCYQGKAGPYTNLVFFFKMQSIVKNADRRKTRYVAMKTSMFLDSNYVHILTFCYFVFGCGRMKRSQVVTKLPLLPFYVIVCLKIIAKSQCFPKIKSFWEMFHLIVCHYKRNSAINDISMSFRWLLQLRHCCCCCCCGRIFPILFVVNDNWHQRREMPRLTGNHRLADNVDWQQSFHWPPTKDENECQNNNWWKFKGWFSTEISFL